MRNIARWIALFLLFFFVIPAPVGRFVYAQDATENSACDGVVDPTQKAACQGCMGSPTNTGTWTAIGCISTNPDDLLGSLLKLAIGMAGGIAFLLILFGGLQIMTSAGNPEQLNAGRELVSSSITGLLLIIFSVFLLQFIGVQVIGIPGFQ